MVVVTLLTDFGLRDTFVGQVKGAVLSVAPGASLVDVSHAVAAQDVLGGAFLLWSAIEVFAAGTIHLAVVDPGVGSARRAIAIRSARGDVLVGPDNGLLWPAIERLGGIERAVELTERRYWRQRLTSSTFHGRDIFGPVAGHLAQGVPLEALGVAVSDPTRLDLPRPAGQRGEILYVDVYGNLVTNFAADATAHGVRLGERLIPFAAYYAAVEPGALLALVGSAGLVEISARGASAAALTGATRGTPVQLETG
jgi:S-adenosylmethionine hydrolase